MPWNSHSGLSHTHQLKNFRQDIQDGHDKKNPVNQITLSIFEYTAYDISILSFKEKEWIYFYSRLSGSKNINNRINRIIDAYK